VVRYLNSSVRQSLIRFDENQKVSLPPKVQQYAQI